MNRALALAIASVLLMVVGYAHSDETVPNLRLAAEVHRLADKAHVVVTATNESSHRISGRFTLDIEFGYRPSDSTAARVNAQIEAVRSRGGRVCRTYPTVFSIPKSITSNDVFSGHRVSLRPGETWVDSVEVGVQSAEFAELPGSFVGKVSLWSGRQAASWRKARQVASTPFAIAVP